MIAAIRVARTAPGPRRGSVPAQAFAFDQLMLGHRDRHGRDVELLTAADRGDRATGQ
jgi:hypothetical protein